MAIKLTKRECNFLSPAVSYGWEIDVSPYRKNGIWASCSTLPVSLGTTCQQLIKNGFLEVLPHSFGFKTIRATDKAMRRKCFQCDAGKLSGGSLCQRCVSGVLQQDKDD